MKRWPPRSLVRLARDAMQVAAGGDRGNSFVVGNKPTCQFDLELDMAVFDRLPLDVRSALNYAPVNYSAAQAVLLAVDKAISPSTLCDVLAAQ